jgi:hypothetical protein
MKIRFTVDFNGTLPLSGGQHQHHGGGVPGMTFMNRGMGSFPECPYSMVSRIAKAPYSSRHDYLKPVYGTT